MPARSLADYLQPGQLVEVGPAQLNTAGAVSNTGLALYKLGVPSRLICKIGADAFSKMVHDFIQGYDPHLFAQPGRKSYFFFR